MWMNKLNLVEICVWISLVYFNPGWEWGVGTIANEQNQESG